MKKKYLTVGTILFWAAVALGRLGLLEMEQSEYSGLSPLCSGALMVGVLAILVSRHDAVRRARRGPPSGTVTHAPQGDSMASAAPGGVRGPEPSAPRLTHDSATATSATVPVAEEQQKRPVSPRVPIDYASEDPAYLKTLLYDDYLKTEHWAAVRSQALARAGNRCQLCARHEGPLHVHHNSYDHLGAERSYDLVVLCERHHRAYHPRMGKRYGGRRSRGRRRRPGSYSRGH